jgi:Cupin domain
MKTLMLLVLLFLMTGTALAQDARVTELMSKDLKELPGREASMITVEYAPGGTDPIHRHNAHAFVYVLEGSIVMQVKGGKEVTLTPARPFMKRLTMFMSWAGMQAPPSRQSSWCSLSRKRALRSWCHCRNKQKFTQEEINDDK